MDGRQEAVVVTGAAKGIGRACVIRLARSGFRVYAGVRKLEDGEALRTEGGANIVPLVVDITAADTVASGAATVRANLGDMQLRGLVNNAGIAVAGPLEFLPVAELRRQLEVNVIGQVAMIQAFLPMLRESGGRIVNIGSIAGRSALPMTGPYSASKFALEAITDALRVELMPAGVDVIILEPGMIATPIWQTSLEAANRVMDQMPAEVWTYYGRIIKGVRARAASVDAKGLPPDVVARVVEIALTTRHPKTRYLIGRDASLRVLLQLLPDRLRDRIIARQLARM